MILNVEPIAHLLAIAIHRQGPAIERIENHQRNEFFRELIRAVIVGTIRDRDRQPVRRA